MNTIEERLLHETLSVLTWCQEVSDIEGRLRAAAGHTQVVQTAGDLHDPIRDARLRQPQNHTRDHMFHPDADAGDDPVEPCVRDTQLFALRLFLGCWTSTRSGA
jgi:hypothetical protein